jgi:hypothetical protein
MKIEVRTNSEEVALVHEEVYERTRRRDAISELEANICRAEEMREEGDAESSVLKLTRVIAEARRRLPNPDSVVAQALGHRITSYLHLYRHSGDKTYLQMMTVDCMIGLGCDVPETQRAKFHLRAGQVEMIQGGADLALALFHLARKKVQLCSTEEAELGGYFAEALTMVGSYEEALIECDQALKILSAVDSVKPFHRLIIASGLYGRRFKPALKTGRYWLAFTSLLYGYAMAWWLKLRYGKTERLSGYHAQLFRK